MQSQGADASSVQALEASSTGVLLAVRSAALREETLAFQVHLARLQEESTVTVRVYCIIVVSNTNRVNLFQNISAMLESTPGEQCLALSISRRRETGNRK